jgi:Xaa-Pro dipeptidase
MASEWDEVWISSGELEVRNYDDQTYPFWQNPWFTWACPGIKFPGLWLKITSTIIELHVLKENNFWHESIDLSRVCNKKIVIKEFSDVEVSPNPNRVLKASCPFYKSLEWERFVKTEYEIYCLQKANDIAIVGHKNAAVLFEQGASELEIHHSYLNKIQHKECDLPYGNIIALNEKSAILHAQEYRKTKVNPKSFLIDAGASYMSYGADITRTYVHSKYKNSIFYDLIFAVTLLQQEIVAKVKLGEFFGEIHHRAWVGIGSILCDSGLFMGSLEECLAEQVPSVFFPHGLGHPLGIQVHDVGAYLKNQSGETIAKDSKHPHLRMRRKVQANAVFTIEPGLYFIPFLLAEAKSKGVSLSSSILKECLPFGGIRIEDNIYLSKESKVVNLTQALV